MRNLAYRSRVRGPSGPQRCWRRGLTRYHEQPMHWLAAFQARDDRVRDRIDEARVGNGSAHVGRTVGKSPTRYQPSSRAPDCRQPSARG